MSNTAAAILDSREPPVIQAALFSALQTLQVTPLVVALETADFVIRDRCDPTPCTVGIERKTASDFLGSFASGRLGSQLDRLAATYTYPILLLEGEFKMTTDGRIKIKSRVTKWSHAAVQMFLWSLQRRGVQILHTAGVAETADLVRILTRRAGERTCIAHCPAPRPGKEVV